MIDVVLVEEEIKRWRGACVSSKNRRVRLHVHGEEREVARQRCLAVEDGDDATGDVERDVVAEAVGRDVEGGDGCVFPILGHGESAEDGLEILPCTDEAQSESCTVDGVCRQLRAPVLVDPQHVDRVFEGAVQEPLDDGAWQGGDIVR